MTKNYSSLNSNTTLGFNKQPLRALASGIDSKMCKTSWFFMVLVILGMPLVQKAAANQDGSANHFTDLPITTSYTFHTVILKSSVDQGQSGGGGHGNPDWVMANGPNIRYSDPGIIIQKSQNKLNY